MESISLVRIDAAHEQVSWFRAAYAEYLSELSRAGSIAFSLDEHGVWQPDLIPFWLADPDARPLVALKAGRPFGFACVGTSAFPYKDPSSDHRLTELYIEASSRRLGLGSLMAKLTLGGLPGIWELSVLRGNSGALEFWRRVLPSVASSPIIETTMPHQLDFRFTVAESSAACG